MLAWVANNRGVMTSIARKVNLSPQFVHLVFRGERSNQEVERLLREAGAPIADRQTEPTAA